LQPTEATKLIAAVFGLAGFAVACLSGIAVGKAGVDALINGMLSMILCYFLGWIAGAVGESVIRDHLRSVQARASQHEANTPRDTP